MKGEVVHAELQGVVYPPLQGARRRDEALAGAALQAAEAAAGGADSRGVVTGRGRRDRG